MPVSKSAVHSSRSSQPDEVLFSEKPVQHSQRYDPEFEFSSSLVKIESL